jgi:hypothetical protein
MRESISDFLRSWSIEELGIGQARTHHALVAADHRRRVGGIDVADDEELVAQPCRP